MVKKKTKEYKYHSLSLPVYFINDVKKHIKNKPEFTSVARYAQEAMKEKMQRDSKIKSFDELSDEHPLKKLYINIQKYEKLKS